ncbi:hypothetical protein PAXRUDRAFT_825591 [Paxillus rubicundulus Ve08.2h10]|uniref:Uncharacterized protein n=1 Tax=Paxillus rubicundulus Ve08.2h10 TaxID=930991 RepID=A0A0D0EAP9_9AGAM|nr:hypothetical protein PAXRUDRAFT_825591 [Paxillus rubicundulus Ve08.2h10]
MNSSNNSRRFRESVTDTRGCCWAAVPGGISQSHSAVLKPWRTWCSESVSYRPPVINSLISVTGYTPPLNKELEDDVRF